jgi:hypothetical protein
MTSRRSRISRTPAIQAPKPAVTPPLFRDTVSPIMAEITAGKQRGRPFRRGESGNSAGRPVGARHKATVAAETLLDGEAEGLTRKVLEMALAGDTVAMRLCLERILPPRRERPVRFNLPKLQSPSDAAAAMAAIAAGVADGNLTPSEAGELSKLVDAYVKALEASDFDQRLRVIEAKGDATRP